MGGHDVQILPHKAQRFYSKSKFVGEETTWAWTEIVTTGNINITVHAYMVVVAGHVSLPLATGYLKLKLTQQQYAESETV